MADVDANEYFESESSWADAATRLAFTPIEPADTAGHSLQTLAIHVHDAKRKLAVEDRTLEAHYGAFMLSQSRKGPAEAQRWATEVSYGPESQPTMIAGHEARMYELGPEVDPDDIDGRNPAVVAWHDGDMFFLVASDSLEATVLLEIAASMYP